MFIPPPPADRDPVRPEQSSSQEFADDYEVPDIRIGGSGGRHNGQTSGGVQRRGVSAAQLAREEAALRLALKQAGHKNMAIGGAVCVFGLLITFGTLAAASGGNGGSYVIAWGAIVFGAIQFFRGATQVSQAGQQ